MLESREPFPVRLDAPEEPLASRWLWLVKWLLLVPHYIVLAFLWAAFVVISTVAFVAILVTGSYPKALFDFNVGVLRWSWRVHYYGYAALGTDRYPPFTLADVPDYPARLHVSYPQKLSRGLVLVKWWLLALPHYVILALFLGGGLWFASREPRGNVLWDTPWGAGGLVGLLVLIAAIMLLFTGRYPRPLYDFVLGMDRWALRVAAYAGLMTDAYPPFRLDMGGPDPGSPAADSIPPHHGGEPAAGGTASQASFEEPHDVSARRGWTGGRIVAVVAGAVLLVNAAGVLVAGSGLFWADRALRDDGYLNAPAASVSSDRYAVVADSVRLEGSGLDWGVDRVLGDVRLQATPSRHDADLFIGIGRTADVQRYLKGVGYTEYSAIGGRLVIGVGLFPWLPTTWTQTDRHADRSGGAPATRPAQAGVWQASAIGDQALVWRPAAGDWTAVVMRIDGQPGVTAQLQLGATLPGIRWIAGGLLALGVLLMAGGALLVGFAARAVSGRSAVPGGAS